MGDFKPVCKQVIKLFRRPAFEGTKGINKSLNIATLD